MRLVVALVSKERAQVMADALRVSIRRETIFCKNGWRCLGCGLALDVQRILAKITLGAARAQFRNNAPSCTFAKTI
jgi:hypothetical protein